MNIFNDVIRLFLLATLVVIGFILAGCDRKETLLDVDTPEGGVEVQRSLETGEITVDAGR